MALVINRGGAVPDVLPAAGPVVTGRIYWDETKTRLLPEGHSEARFLAYPEGTVVTPALLQELALLEDIVDTSAPAAKLGRRPRDKARRLAETKDDHQIAPGVVADTSLDGEAHVIAVEPATPLRNGVDK